MTYPVDSHDDLVSCLDCLADNIRQARAKATTKKRDDLMLVFTLLNDSSMRVASAKAWAWMASAKPAIGKGE